MKKNNSIIDYKLRHAWLSIQKMYNEQAASFGATMSSAFTLLSIDPKKGTPSSLLGPRMGINPTSISRLLNELEKNKQITRTTSEKDKRSIIIKLTDDGLKMRDLAKKYVLNFYQTIEENIPKKKLQIFYEVLETIDDIATKKKEENKNEKTH